MFQYGTFDVTKKCVRQKFATTTQQSNQSVNAIKNKDVCNTKSTKNAPRVIKNSWGYFYKTTTIFGGNMTYKQLLRDIFYDYDQTHYDILCDVLLTSEQQAEKILAKYDTSQLTQDEFANLKKLIVQREVGEYMVFITRHKDVLDSDMTDNEKFALLMEKCDNENLTTKERTLLQKRIRRHIYDHHVGKILQNLVDDLGLNKKKS